ncbi:MAG: DMT family transporter [Chloroflexi bacterium]|nr:DMT family transporter [Chloroflexota bacterium]
MTSNPAQAEAPLPAAQVSWQPFAAMAIGVMAVSTAAILIRLAQDEGVSSLVLAASRLCIASLMLTPVVLSRHRQELRTLAWPDVRLMVLSGLMLSMHFATWISSLEYTSVVNSVTIVTTSPLWVAVLAWLLLNEKLKSAALVAMALAFGGGILVSLSGETGDPTTRHAPLLGNGLALVGALAVAVYFIIGRSLRSRLSALLYIWIVYSAAAISLVIVVVILGLPVAGFSKEAYLWIALMGLLPQLIGHSSFNYALGFLPAAYVSLVILLEPVASGILAIFFLDEWPVFLQVIGAALILTGIGFASKDQQSGKPSEN